MIVNDEISIIHFIKIIFKVNFEISENNILTA